MLPSPQREKLGVPQASYSSHVTDATMIADDEGPMANVLGEDNTRRRASGVQPLPPGAMSVTPLAPHSPAHLTRRGSDTPPTSPTQGLLQPEDTNHVQFAEYAANDKKPTWVSNPPAKGSADGTQSKLLSGWVPTPLRVAFWLPLVIFMVLGAIALELALHYTNKRQGWATTSSDFSNQAGFMHYVYTLPPVAVAMVLTALWAWTDIEIKKMQPYVDLIHGDSPPSRSLLLDYTRQNNFVVWSYAAANRHYLVALASLMGILCLCFQPLAAALLTVRDTYWPEPLMQVQLLGAVGLNQNAEFQDLTSFLSAAGYASASVLYNLGDPSFIHGAYTVAPFQIPNIVSNGTVFANTTAVKSNPGCRTPDTLNMVQNTDGSGWTNSASSNSCNVTWTVDKNATSLFGTSIPVCSNSSSTPPQFSPVIFWFFTYEPTAMASVTFCSPSILLVDVSVTVDIASGNLTNVAELNPFVTGSSNFSQFSGNVTGAPLNGRAYNGLDFSLVDADRFVQARQSAIQLQMPAAVFQSAESSLQGLNAVFNTDGFVELSTQVYTTYMKLIAKEVYFLPTALPMDVEVKTVRKRIWLSSTAVHLLATAMLMLALFSTTIHLFHRADRRNLHLAHQPGTIASAVSISGQTGLGNLLANRSRDEDIVEALRNKKFRIDSRTMKIVMEGEDGYEFAASPGPHRRQSIFGKLQSQATNWRSLVPPGTPTTPRRSSKRFSQNPVTPTAEETV